MLSLSGGTEADAEADTGGADERIQHRAVENLDWSLWGRHQGWVLPTRGYPSWALLRTSGGALMSGKQLLSEIVAAIAFVVTIVSLFVIWAVWS